MDFTIATYKRLIQAFKDNGYRMVTVRTFIEEDCSGKVIALRHDVDEQPRNALKMAEVERDLGVCATYYFRRVPRATIRTSYARLRVWVTR